jgi:hypothetical protein
LTFIGKVSENLTVSSGLACIATSCSGVERCISDEKVCLKVLGFQKDALCTWYDYAPFPHCACCVCIVATRRSVKSPCLVVNFLIILETLSPEGHWNLATVVRMIMV